MIGPKVLKRDLPPKEFTPKVKRLLSARSDDLCEGCGMATATENHHRLYKSRGGRGNLANGISLCGWGNHTGCHGEAHTGEGERKGWSVPSGRDPSTWPVLRRGAWVRYFDEPDVDGRWFELLTVDQAVALMLGKEVDVGVVQGG